MPTKNALAKWCGGSFLEFEALPHRQVLLLVDGSKFRVATATALSRQGFRPGDAEASRKILETAESPGKHSLVNVSTHQMPRAREIRIGPALGTRLTCERNAHAVPVFPGISYDFPLFDHCFPVFPTYSRVFP